MHLRFPRIAVSNATTTNNPVMCNNIVSHSKCHRITLQIHYILYNPYRNVFIEAVNIRIFIVPKLNIYTLQHVNEIKFWKMRNVSNPIPSRRYLLTKRMWVTTIINYSQAEDRFVFCFVPMKCSCESENSIVLSAKKKTLARSLTGCQLRTPEEFR